MKITMMKKEKIMSKSLHISQIKGDVKYICNVCNQLVQEREYCFEIIKAVLDEYYECECHLIDKDEIDTAKPDAWVKV